MLIQNKLYKGDVTLSFESFRHRYVWEEKDEVIPSVTTILKVINKPALVNWASNMAVDYISEQIQPGVSYDEIELINIFKNGRKAHWQKKTDAGDIGTFVHNWIEKYINGENPGMPVNPELKVSILKFLLWVEKHDVKFLVSEQVVFSKKYKYSGTIDFICTIDGKLYIGDLKTSKGIYAEYWIQTSAYRNARVEEYPEEDYTGQLIVRVGKDGTFEFAIMRDDSMYKEMFKCFVASLLLTKGLEAVEGFSPERK